jgi:hypothetical protein
LKNNLRLHLLTYKKLIKNKKMMFPYYQAQVQQAPPRKNSCSFCGNHQHFIRDCGQIGVMLHRFINTENKDDAMNLLRAQNNSALQRFLSLLGYSVKNLNKNDTLRLIEARWIFFRNSLQDMILKGEMIRDVKTYGMLYK